ncbi:TPA: cell division protein FtsK, partial [Staphylococcus aureus]|nr:cell division protein FtsK [Staphylococcus aureus]
MTMNEIALFKGVRIQPYFKHIDFIFAGVFAFIFLTYRILTLWQGYISQQKALDVVEVYQYFKPHFLYLVIGTLIVFIIAKLIAQFV